MGFVTILAIRDDIIAPEGVVLCCKIAKNSATLLTKSVTNAMSMAPVPSLLILFSDQYYACNDKF